MTGCRSYEVVNVGVTSAMRLMITSYLIISLAVSACWSWNGGSGQYTGEAISRSRASCVSAGSCYPLVCTHNSDCTKHNDGMSCITGVCSCGTFQAIYKSGGNYTCLNEKKYDESCDVTAQCMSHNAYCSTATKKCVCLPDFKSYGTSCYAGYMGHGITSDSKGTSEVKTTFTLSGSSITSLPCSVSDSKLFVVEPDNTENIKFVMYYAYTGASESNVAAIVKALSIKSWKADVSYNYYWFTWAEESSSPHFYIYGNSEAVSSSRTKVVDTYFSSATTSATLYLKRRYKTSYSSDDITFYPYLASSTIYLASGGLDSSCNTSDTNPCKVPHSECKTSKCACSTGYYIYYYQNKAFSCLKEADNVGDFCLYTAGCANLTSATCSHDNKCMCLDDYVQVSGECLKKVVTLGGACNVTGICTISNSNCSSNVCSCQDGYVQCGNACLKDGVGYGDACECGAQCLVSENTQCMWQGSARTCQCYNTYTLRNTTCYPGYAVYPDSNDGSRSFDITDSSETSLYIDWSCSAQYTVLVTASAESKVSFTIHMNNTITIQYNSTTAVNATAPSGSTRFTLGWVASSSDTVFSVRDNDTTVLEQTQSGVSFSPTQITVTQTSTAHTWKFYPLVSWITATKYLSGDSCKQDKIGDSSNCANSHGVCMNNGICGCRKEKGSTSYINYLGSCLEVASSVGDSCSVWEQCEYMSADCATSSCSCTSGYVDVLDNCYQGSAVGASCAVTSDCASPYTTCSNTTCSCTSNTHQADDTCYTCVAVSSNSASTIQLLTATMSLKLATKTSVDFVATVTTDNTTIVYTIATSGTSSISVDGAQITSSTDSVTDTVLMFTWSDSSVGVVGASFSMNATTSANITVTQPPTFKIKNSDTNTAMFCPYLNVVKVI